MMPNQKNNKIIHHSVKSKCFALNGFHSLEASIDGVHENYGLATKQFQFE